ncbi:MAG: substrate-binding domain-containing protein, partial [Lawsonibacter sp.]|nr:substrate-binding domain-containing protein [Lawsonibacter sp.]
MKMKKAMALVLALALSLSLTACGGGSKSGGNTSTPAPTASGSTSSSAAGQTGAGMKIGLAMPTQSSERWINDGGNMKQKLEALGYEVVLQYAEDDVQTQVSQIENMIAQNVDCLVIAAIDSGALTSVEAQAKDAGIPIIAYDRLLMDTDAVSYYASFDNEGVG